MKHYTEYEHIAPNIFRYKKGKGVQYYDDTIYTFDIETTSLFLIDGMWQAFDYSKSPEFYSNRPKAGLVYLWGFCAEGETYYGRTLEEFEKTLCEISDPNVTKIIWVHNFSFEFQFLINIIKDLEVFARKPHKIIKAYSAEYNIEFRCTNVLTNTKLEKIPETYNLPIKKLKGDLDYRLCRNPLTKIYEKEMQYQDNDVKIVYEYIKIMREEYEHLADIPLTQTGKVRREVKLRFKGDKSYYAKLAKMYPENHVEFKRLLDAFAGGYTHANVMHTGRILKNVFSFDLASSYPAVMVMCKYPMSKFMRVVTDINKLDFDKYAMIATITFHNIRSKGCNNYLSLSKALDYKATSVDNGRVINADMVKYTITDVDYQIILENYEFDSMEVNESYIATKGYLPQTYIDYILKLYSDKTSLKGTGQDVLYARIKEFINSLYGMSVTNLIQDEVMYENELWNILPLSEADIDKQLQEKVAKHQVFLNYAWGVWVTAYARQRLWKVINKLDYDVVYVDTDSVKFINKKNIKTILSVNEEWLDKLKHRGIDYDLLAPFDNEGKRHPIGVFEQEKTADKFITLGAKKYCYQIGDEITVTVSGVPKEDGGKILGKIENFKDGYVFGYEAGKLASYYCDEQEPMEVIDYQGNSYKSTYRHGLCLMPTTYKVGLTPEYKDLIYYFDMQTSTHLSVLQSDFLRPEVSQIIMKGVSH